MKIQFKVMLLCRKLQRLIKIDGPNTIARAVTATHLYLMYDSMRRVVLQKTKLIKRKCKKKAEMILIDVLQNNQPIFRLRERGVLTMKKVHVSVEKLIRYRNTRFEFLMQLKHFI